MAEGSLSRRYAKALIELGVEGSCVERIADDLHTFRAVLDTGDGALRKAMENPGISVTERRAVLDQVLGRLDLHPLVANFVSLLLDKHRFTELDSMKRAYDAMADERAGRVRATVTTAHDLSSGMAAEVQQALASATGKDVVVSYDVDPTLIGGVVAKIGDLVIDASVRARLEQLRQQLLSEPSVPVGEA